MSTTVDNRVVEMQFKNEDFERGVKQTITSLDGLKKALEINTNSLDLSRVQKEADSLNLERVADSVEVLSNRFSNLGIVGMEVLKRLTNGAINLVEKMGQITIGQIITGGKGRAQKIADARFKLEGLLDTADDVTDAFTAASKAVDGTAYGMDAAVNTASQLVSSGVELGKEGEHMEKVLKGVAGLAAMTNTDFDYMGNIFATVAGNGRLMGMQLSQISAHGVNAAAVLAKAMGKTESEIREMTSRGEISFEQFSDAMSDAFGEQAAKADKTLTGVLTNIRAQLSRIGAIFAAGIIENDTLIEFLGTVKAAIRAIVVALGPLEAPFKSIVTAIANLGSSILGLVYDKEAGKFFKGDMFSSFVNVVASVFNKVAGFIDGITERINTFANKSGIKQVAEEVKETVDNIDESVEKVKEIAKTIWFGDPTGRNPYGNGQTRVDALGTMYNQVQGYVNAMKEADFDMEKADQIYAQMAIESTDEVTDAKKREMEARLGLNKVSNESVENAEKSTQAFSPLVNVLSNLMKGVASIGKAFKKVFSVKDLKASIGQLTSSFGKVVKSIGFTEERASNLESFFTGLFSIFKMVGDVLVNLVSGGFELLAKVLPTIINGISTFIGFIGNAINSFREFVESNNLLVRAGRFIVDTFTKVTSTLKEFFSKFVELPAVQKLKEEFIDIYDRVGSQLIKWFGDAKGALGDFFGVFDDADDTTMNRILTTINDALETMMGLAGDAKGHISDFFARFKKGGDLEKTAIYLGKVNDGYEDIKKTTDSLAHSGSVGEFLSNMGEAFGVGSSDGILAKGEEVLKKLANGFKNIDLAKLTLIGLSGSLVAASVSFSVFTYKISDAVQAFAELPRQLTGVFQSMRGALMGVQQYFKRKGDAKMITQLAIAIGLLFASIAALAVIGHKYDLTKPMIAMSLVVGLLTVMIGVISSLSNKIEDADKFNKTMEAFAKALLSVGASIFLVAAAMAVMAEIDWDKDAWISLGVLVGLMAALIGVVAVINKLGPEIKSSGLWLIFYAGSVYLLVRALNLLNKMDITGIGKKLGVLAGAMLLVGMVAAASSNMSFGSGLGLLALVSSIIALEIALKWLIKFGVDKDDLEKNVSAIIIAVLSLGAIAGYMIVVGNMVHNPTGVAATILSAILAVIAVSKALKKVSQIPADKLLGATTALTVLMVTMGALIYVIGMFGQGNRIKQAGSAILKIALALGALSLVIAFLGYLDKDTLKQGGEAVAQLTALMVAIILATKFSGATDPKAFLAMIAVMATLALLVSLMSFIEDKEALTQAAVIFGGVLIAFAFSMWLACRRARTITVQPLIQMVNAIIMIGVMLMGLTWLTNKYGTIKPLIAAAGAMAGVLLALGICAKIMMTSFTKQGVGPAKMKEVTKALELIVVIVGIIGLILTLISAVAKDNWTTLLAAGASMVSVLFVMAKMLQIINEKIPGGATSVKKLNDKLACLKWLLIAMAVIGGSIALIAYAGQGNWATVGMAAAGLLVLIAALTGVYWALNSIKGSGKDMLVKAEALALISVALIPAAIALSLLAKFDYNSIMAAGLALSLTIFALAAALGGLTALAKSGGAGVMFGVAAAFGVLSILFATSVYIIAKAIDVVVNAINNLASIDYDKIDTAKLGELISLLMKLSLTAIVTSIGISAISASLVLLGGAMIVVGVGISTILLTATAFVKALNKLLETFERITTSADQIAKGIKLITTALTLSIKDIAVGVAMGFALFVQTLALKAVIIGTAIKNFLLTVIDIISEIKIDVERKVIESVTELFEMLEETLPELFRHFNNVVLACMAELAMSAQMYGYFGAIIASEFAIGLMAGLASKADELVDEATYLALSIIKALKDTFDEYKDTIGSGIEEAYSNFAAGYWDLQAKSPLAPKKWKEFASQQAQFMRDNAESVHNTFEQDWERLSQEHADRDAEALYGAQNNAIANYDTSNIEKTAANKQNKILNQSDTAGKAAEDTIENFFGTLDGIDISKYGNGEQLKQYFFGKLTGSTTQAFEESEGILASEVEKWDDKAIDALKADGYRLNEAGTEWVKPITKGATDAIEGKEGDDALSSISDFLGLSGNGSDGIGGLLNGFSAEMSDSADESGGNFIDGLFNKLSSDESLSMLGDAAGMDADAITKAFNENLEIESPSKVAMRSMGYWIDGLLIPMNSDFNNKRLSDAAVKNANSIMGSFNNQISDASTIFTPTIRPVLDTNNMGQYSGFMDILNNPTTVQLAADSQLAIKDNNQMQLANQVAALQASVDKLANTDFSHMMDGVNINVNADTTVDGTVLRKTASNYTIRQINKEEMGYMMATGGRY